MTTHEGRRGLPHTPDVDAVMGRRIPRCSSSRTACASSTSALPTIIIKPTDVPTAQGEAQAYE